MTSGEQLRELDESARRAGYLVTEHIDAIVELAEREAEAVRREAERDAEAIRSNAADFAERLLDHIHRLELPLRESVVGIRAEGESLPRRVAEHEPPSEQAAAEPRREEEDSELPREEEDSELPLFEAMDQELAAFTPELVVTPLTKQEARIGRRLRHLRSRLSQGSSQAGGAFITKEGHCAVCDRPFAAGSPSDLALSSWRVNGDVGLCPECQGERWQLPDGASLPFRSSES